MPEDRAKCSQSRKENFLDNKLCKCFRPKFESQNFSSFHNPFTCPIERTKLFFLCSIVLDFNLMLHLNQLTSKEKENFSPSRKIHSDEEKLSFQREKLLVFSSGVAFVWKIFRFLCQFQAKCHHRVLIRQSSLVPTWPRQSIMTQPDHSTLILC